jgi:hypothetical protein
MFIHRPTEMKAPENPGFRFYVGLSVFIASFFMLPTGLVLREFVAGSFWKGFLVGGDFWDKLRALFIYRAKARFEEDPEKQ